MLDMSTLPSEGYRTIAVETEIPWPNVPTTVSFCEQELQLLPDSDDTARMIRVKTTAELTSIDADKLILEFLSAIAWSDQRGAATTLGNWCTVPLDIGKGPRGMTGDGRFPYLANPSSAKAKLALALYREGLSANLIPYKFLGFFKVINIIRGTGKEQREWIRNNTKHVSDKEALSRIGEIQNAGRDVADYLYSSGRCAVAHAFDQNNVVNPDEPKHLIRLSQDLPVVRELARIAIERELGVVSRKQWDLQR